MPKMFILKYFFEFEVLFWKPEINIDFGPLQANLIFRR